MGWGYPRGRCETCGGFRRQERSVALRLHVTALRTMLKSNNGEPIMKMMSVIAMTPKEGAADEITDLIVQSRADCVDGLDANMF